MKYFFVISFYDILHRLLLNTKKINCEQPNDPIVNDLRLRIQHDRPFFS